MLFWDFERWIIKLFVSWQNLANIFQTVHVKTSCVGKVCISKLMNVSECITFLFLLLRLLTFWLKCKKWKDGFFRYVTFFFEIYLKLIFLYASNPILMTYVRQYVVLCFKKLWVKVPYLQFLVSASIWIWLFIKQTNDLRCV